MFLFFIGADIPWYLHLTAIIVAAVLAISFNGVAQIYIKIRSLAKLLHSCQLLCRVARTQQPSTRNKSAPQIQ